MAISEANVKTNRMVSTRKNLTFQENFMDKWRNNISLKKDTERVVITSERLDTSYCQIEG